ncbi:MAG: hypothetical protein JWM26_1155, partial [Betaproteobacteria bacterium]|nr:hypothetical protein [Betaproteobacteria bacterium]
MKTNAWLLRPIALAVSSCFSLPALANPTGAQVIQGTVSFQGSGTNNLTV